MISYISYFLIQVLKVVNFCLSIVLTTDHMFWCFVFLLPFSSKYVSNFPVIFYYCMSFLVFVTQLQNIWRFCKYLSVTCFKFNIYCGPGTYFIWFQSLEVYFSVILGPSIDGLFVCLFNVHVKRSFLKCLFCKYQIVFQIYLLIFLCTYPTNYWERC